MSPLTLDWHRTYIDTSALVSLFARETAGVAVLTHLDQAHQQGSLVISDWVITELASALSLKRRRGDINDAEHRTIWQAFSAECGGWFDVEPVATADLAAATEHCLVHATGLRSGDALHLAITQRVGCTALLSLDDTLNRNARDLGLTIFVA